jgi:NAD+ kinase
VASYIHRYGLYRGRPAGRTTAFRPDELRPVIVQDKRNPRALELASRFGFTQDAEEPNVVVVIGGDGTMLKAILKHWRRRLPFMGINAGRRGFLLNESEEVLESDWVVRQLPLLYVESVTKDGQSRHALGFNEMWAERQTGQSAWLEVKVDGEVRLPRLVGDGALLSTAAGSTAYARAMGATPLLVDTGALLLVGNNVMEPANWKSALLSLDAVVELRTLDPEKRPVRVFVDGVLQGEVLSVKSRLSRIAAAELVFSPRHDMAQKLAEIQFPLS